MIDTGRINKLFNALFEIERLKAECSQLMTNGAWQATQIAKLIDERDAYKAQHDELVLETAAERDAAQADAKRWQYSVAIGPNLSMNWLDVYEDWDGEGDFTTAVDAAKEGEQS